VDGRRDRELAPAHDGTHPGEFDPAVERDNLTSSVGHLQHETRLCRSRRATRARRRPSRRKSRKGIHSSHEQSDRQDPPLAAPRQEAEDLAAVHRLDVQTARRALPTQLDAELGETVVRQAVQGAGPSVPISSNARARSTRRGHNPARAFRLGSGASTARRHSRQSEVRDHRVSVGAERTLAWASVHE
jgi:hypothetical protein